jgi:glyoxylase-like metal-dependent hydrolase (beta-lactamase superfamily II)
MQGSSDWLEVGDRIFTRRYVFADQQIGVVLGGGEVLVIDTRSTPGQARELIDDIRLLTRDPVRVVIDTHWHSDHVFGNHEFRPATIWGHELCRAGMLEKGEAQRAALTAALPELAEELAAVVIDPPDRTFEDVASVEVGGRLVELRYLGRGHTDADIVVLVPDAGVTFAGDLLENDATPWFGDAYPIDWADTVARLLPLVVGPVVPGHGSVGDRGFVERQLGEFRQVADAAARLHAGSLDRDAALDAMPYRRDLCVQPLDRAMAQLRGELDREAGPSDGPGEP